MKTLYLHGALAERFGDSFELSVSTPAEAVKALQVQIPGFREAIEAGSWHVFRGPLERQDTDDEERILMELAEEDEIHLMPAMSGAGSGGLMAVVGIILIAAGFLTGGLSTGVGLALIAGGAGLVVGGIVSMTMKVPGADTNTSGSDDRASFLFSGPKNTSVQGVAIPRGYGRVRCGSIVISAGLYAEEIPLDSTGIA